MSRYANGQPIRLSTTITDLTGTLVDAGALVLTIQKPDVSQQTYGTPAHDSTGKYHQDIPTTDLIQNGHYQYKWVATGTGAGVSRGEFDVYDPFETTVLSLQDAKAQLNIPLTNTTNDDEIMSYLDTIGQMIELFTGGPVYTRTITERVMATQGWTTLCLRKRPVVAITSITDIITGIPMGLTDLDVDTNSGIVRRVLGWPFWSRGTNYIVVYTAGWGTSVPAAFNSAARIIIQHLWRTQRGPAMRPLGGDEETVMPGMSYAIPNRAEQLLAPYAIESYV
jgi:hypothetical protein